jgi:hypothetical protein
MVYSYIQPAGDVWRQGPGGANADGTLPSLWNIDFICVPNAELLYNALTDETIIEEGHRFRKTSIFPHQIRYLLHIVYQ